MHSSNEIAPNGLSYREIYERQTEYMHSLNALLASSQELEARWWSYSVSHSTFDMVVGDPLGEKPNIVLCCPGVNRITGPIHWPNQQLHVEWSYDRSRRPIWQYTLIDERAGFRVETDLLLWRQNHNILMNPSLWFAMRAPAESYIQYSCPYCEHVSYGYHPYCAACGTKLPSAAKMFGIGLTHPLFNT